MAKELPYFRFTAGEWLTDDISQESYELKGVFIDFCAWYWMQDCDVSYDRASKRFANAKHLLSKLIECDLIKIETTESEKKISIKFLDSQFFIASEISEKRKNAGKLGGKTRFEANAKQNEANAKQNEANLYKDKDKDKDKDNYKDKDKDNYKDKDKDNYKDKDKTTPLPPSGGVAEKLVKRKDGSWVLCDAHVIADNPHLQDSEFKILFEGHMNEHGLATRSERAIQARLKLLRGLALVDAKNALNRSIANGWTGVFVDRVKTQKTQRAEKEGREYAERFEVGQF